MKFGFDIHGVIDSRPPLFAALTSALVDAGHEVHILTGPPPSTELFIELRAYGIRWTHFFSIVQYHIDQKTEGMWQDEKGLWWMNPYVWDKTKAEYCEAHDIDMHLDDSDTYAYFFKTPYCRFLSRDSHRIQKTRI